MFNKEHGCFWWLYMGWWSLVGADDEPWQPETDPSKLKYESSINITEGIFGGPRIDQLTDQQKDWLSRSGEKLSEIDLFPNTEIYNIKHEMLKNFYPAKIASSRLPKVDTSDNLIERLLNLIRKCIDIEK